MFGKRLVSGVILLIITIGIVILSGPALITAVSLISLIGLFELYRILKFEYSPLAFVSYAISLLLDGCVAYGEKEWIMYVIVGGLLLQLVVYVLFYPKYSSEHVTMAFFGIIYVSCLLSYIYQVRTLDDGALIVWMIFIGAWGSDTCAYCVGNLYGKHKMPSNLSTLSPHKSLEGCVGGVAGAAIIGAIYAFCVREHLMGMDNPVVAFAIIGAFASLLSQFGDLTASAIKRNYNIKDYGTLIPGHGGILDRFDSIIFTAPLVYMLAILF